MCSHEGQHEGQHLSQLCVRAARVGEANERAVGSVALTSQSPQDRPGAMRVVSSHAAEWEVVTGLQQWTGKLCVTQGASFVL